MDSHFAEPEVFMKLLNVYCSSFYGSNLWNLYSAEVDKIVFKPDQVLPNQNLTICLFQAQSRFGWYFPGGGGGNNRN